MSRAHRRAASAGLTCLVTTAALCCVGDGSVAVRGTVVTEDGTPIDECVLVLKDVEHERVVGTVTVPSTFDEGFVVAPGRREYRAEIACDGYETRYTSEILVSDVPKGTIWDPNDLGIIVMGRQSGMRRHGKLH